MVECLTHKPESPSLNDMNRTFVTNNQNNIDIGLRTFDFYRFKEKSGYPCICSGLWYLTILKVVIS